MKSWETLALVSFLGIGGFAQQTSRPELKLRIVVEKDTYTLNERVTVKSEFTNLTSKTICFPVPDQDCKTTATGSVLTTGEPAGARDYDLFLCHAHGGGPTRAELGSEIRNRWIKLPPNAVYVTKPAQAIASLNQTGEWKLKASYDPPVGAYSRDYEKMLQSAAEDEGCSLPRSMVDAEPKIISVLPSKD